MTLCINKPNITLIAKDGLKEKSFAPINHLDFSNIKFPPAKT